MIHLQNPPRLCQCESTPRELRAWLLSAQRSRPSVAIEGLVQVIEYLGDYGRSSDLLDRMPHPVTEMSDNATLATTIAKLLLLTLVGEHTPAWLP